MPARLAGYAALIDAFDLPVPLHHDMAAIAIRGARRKEGGWTVFPVAQRLGDTVIDHLVFAIRYEGVHLLTLKKLFQRFDPEDLAVALRAKPTSGYLRRLAFFYEWLTGLRLDLPDLKQGDYVDALDPKLQFGTTGTNLPRFRIRNNLPGTPAFCPTVSRTRVLDQFIALDLSSATYRVVESASPELIARAAAFLLLSDSKASFAIEGEARAHDRIRRWGTVIGQAGRERPTIDRFLHLQREVIGNARFVRIGLRTGGGFVGRHDVTGQPLPDHISARAEDLGDLLEGLGAFDAVSEASSYHPVLTAACVAFGFVYIHPFEDGNGRIHRFLMHDVLARTYFTPPGIVFPISSVILDDLGRYRDVLECVSRPLLDWIAWRPAERGNIVVTNDTADYYRYFDATPHAEYLFRCIARAVEHDLPQELAYLGNRDAFHRRVTQIVDMPERTIDLLLRFLQQNHGRLSRRALTHEFAELHAEEVEQIEAIFADLFQGSGDSG